MRFFGAYDGGHRISKYVEDLRVNGVDEFANALEEVLARRTVSYTTTSLSTNYCVQTTSVDLFHGGPAGTGKLALAATIAPNVRVSIHHVDRTRQQYEADEPADLPPECADVINEFLHTSGTCGPTLFQCNTANPYGVHGRASPKATGPPPSVTATTLLHPILTDFGLASFDAESHVVVITDLTVFDRVLKAVELFHTRGRGHAVSMLRQASIGTEDA
ncbi:hypothetical protein EDB86DRAFT_3216132 [Lactarius hatsudake]|nr:hypothetical protein EDB86DRAFT_3216132 [Lactarius hatsudake]